MKLSTREDIEAPIDHVWAAIADFDRFERQALRRGAEVRRNDPANAPGLHSEWEIGFTYRGKPRAIDAVITEFERPDRLRMNSRSGGLDGLLDLELMSLSPRRTRLNVMLELAPRNLQARLLVQSLKFARGNLNKRFSNRVYDFAQDVEGRYINAG